VKDVTSNKLLATSKLTIAVTDNTAGFKVIILYFKIKRDIAQKA